MLPFREALPHKRPMFRFFDRNHEMSSGQVAGRALLWEAIGAASGDRQLFQGMQHNRRDGADVVCPALQSETA
jgi:hypothetical protein